jgi:GDP-L-fucose synthase
MAAMPTNLYGPNDNYDLNNSHVLPALIRKMHDAKKRWDTEVVVWGTGTPKREFLYSDDMADACLYLLEQPESKLTDLFNDEQPPLVNIGCGEDLAIRELVEIIAKVVGYSGKLLFDSTKPDGTMQKLTEVSRMKNMGWATSTPLHKGILTVYKSYTNEANKYPQNSEDL